MAKSRPLPPSVRRKLYVIRSKPRKHEFESMVKKAAKRNKKERGQ